MQEAIDDLIAIFHGLPQPYLVLDRNLTIVGASDAYLALTRRARDDIVGRHILEAFPDNPAAAETVEQGPLEVSLRHVLATKSPHEMAVIRYDIPQPGGGFVQKFWTPVHTPVLGADGVVNFIIQSPMDVTEKVLERREADARLRVALHAADLATWEYEPETDLWRRSHAVDELFGYAPGEGGPVAAPFFARIHADDFGRVMREVRAAVDSPDQTSMRFDYRVVRPNGDTRHISSRGEVLRTSGGKARMIGVMMDVTVERTREAELAASVAAQKDLLGQKDLLLAEVNHRVKNSLQLVVSTLRLQARRIESPDLVAAFDQAVSRVRAIISVHERLYRDDNSLSVAMEEHLLKLCLDIAGVELGSNIHVDVEDFSLPPEIAIPLSVIVNELLVASLEAGDDTTAIAVSLKRTNEELVELAVADTQTMPSRRKPLEGLSERLVATMTRQIDGTMTEVIDGGHMVRVSFPWRVG
ncbi:histidine kinase dimerization/phosphoacceptor domain -containing protein [Rhizobium sp. SIMBA_035]